MPARSRPYLAHRFGHSSRGEQVVVRFCNVVKRSKMVNRGRLVLGFRTGFSLSSKLDVLLLKLLVLALGKKSLLHPLQYNGIARLSAGFLCAKSRG